MTDNIEASGKIIDLMEALKASLAKEKQRDATIAGVPVRVDDAIPPDEVHAVSIVDGKPQCA